MMVVVRDPRVGGAVYPLCGVDVLRLGRWRRRPRLYPVGGQFAVRLRPMSGVGPLATLMGLASI